MMNSAFFTNDSTGYAIGFSGIVMRTTNSGNSWEVLTFDLDDITDIWFTDESTGYISGYSGLIYKTTDAGLIWVPKHLFTTYRIYGIYFRDTYSGYAVGEWGMILKTSDNGPISVPEPDSESVEVPGFIRIFPNPVTNETLIQFDRDQMESILEISVLNNSGTKFDEIKFENSSSTGNKIIWNKGNLPAGVYFLVVRTLKGISTEKFIIL
jgi:hypothetical protein